nr:MAG TPA: hypothetical protein [Caudoviricetes sp.]
MCNLRLQIYRIRKTRRIHAPLIPFLCEILRFQQKNQ